MVKVTKIDTPKAKKTKLYWGTLLLSWIPFIGLAFSLNGVIRSSLKVIKSMKAKKIDKRAIVGALLSSIALLISLVAINAALNPSPSITLANAETSTDDSSYMLTGKISNMAYENSKLTINDVAVSLNNGEYSHKVDLKEGDNTFSIVATNDNGETKKSISIHRTTQAEFAARTEAERLAAEKKAAELRGEEEKKAQEKAKGEARVAKEKAEANAKVAAEAREPRHTYDEFYEWVTTYMRSPDGSGLTRMSYISAQCDAWKDLDGDGDKDQYFDKSCLQDKYKDYIKPSAFEYGSSADNGGGWLCPNGQEYQYLCSRLFDMETHIKAQFSGAYGVNVDEEKEKAKTIYNEIALTKGGN